MPSRSALLNEVKGDAVPSEVRDASLTLGKTKEGLLGKTKEGLIGRTKEGLLGKTKEGLLGTTKEGLIGRTIKRTLGIGRTIKKDARQDKVGGLEIPCYA